MMFRYECSLLTVFVPPSSLLSAVEHQETHPPLLATSGRVMSKEITRKFALCVLQCSDMGAVFPIESRSQRISNHVLIPSLWCSPNVNEDDAIDSLKSKSALQCSKSCLANDKCWMWEWGPAENGGFFCWLYDFEASTVTWTKDGKSTSGYISCQEASDHAEAS